MYRTTYFGDRTISGIINILKEKQSMFQLNGGSLEISENPFALEIVTPIMKKAHSFTFSKDIVFVDLSGSCDQGNSTITLFFGASKIGGVPLGVVIHQHQTKHDYLNSFSFLKKCLGEEAFYGQFYPTVFMTDVSIAEHQVLSSVFPASTLLLCAFHICQALWRWLWKSKHNIDTSEGQTKMVLF